MLAHLEKLSAEGVELYETVSNAALIEAIRKNPQKSPDESLTWHHCLSKTVGNKPGVMHLVSREQHEDRAFSHIFHPAKRADFMSGLYREGRQWIYLRVIR